MADTRFFIDSGARLRRLREWLGYNQGGFARHLGVAATVYRDYENGRRTRGWSRFGPLVGERTGVSLDWLFCGVGGEDVPRRVGGQPMARGREA